MRCVRKVHYCLAKSSPNCYLSILRGLLRLRFLVGTEAMRGRMGNDATSIGEHNFHPLHRYGVIKCGPCTLAARYCSHIGVAKILPAKFCIYARAAFYRACLSVQGIGPRPQVEGCPTHMSLSFNVRQCNGGTERLPKTDRDPERKSG